MKRLLSVAEAAELLGASPDFIRDHRAELGVVRLGRKLRFDEDAIARWIAGGGSPAFVPGPSVAVDAPEWGSHGRAFRARRAIR